ncbi:MAG: Uncharacterized protein FD130_1363 [Halothiobacillaceae bacterium]|nr:MAG: Uncharacterized protein FD130_1363 [Halothiobacillaceae bacterium]
MYPYHLPKKTLAVLVASMGLLSALPAAASVIDTLTAQTTVRAGSKVPVVDGPNSNAISTSAGSNDSDIDPSSQASATSFGYSSGPYGAGGNGSGIFDSSGKFQRQWDITNDSGVAQNYSFNFFIYYGGMSASDNGAGGTGYAEYMVDILRDGSTSLFSSAAKIESDGTLTRSGTILNGASHLGSSYSWNGTNFTIDLGILNPGDSTSVRYDLIGHAFGDYGFVPDDCNGYGYGYGDGDVHILGVEDEEFCTVTGTSNAFLGDPDSLNSTPIPGIGIIARAVPEPAMFGLMGMGLVGLLGLRRRYQN